MRRIFIIILTLAIVTAAIAQTRTFSINGQHITIDVASTVDDYYKASLNGRWTCIPAVLEYAAEKANLSKAQYLYGMSYMQGIDRERNVTEGMRWLKKAADQGEKEAASELGAYYEESGQYSDAEKYLLKACTLGGNFAYFNLGNHYMTLDNAQLAEKYYKLAINLGPKGQVESIHNLNILYVRQMRITDSLVILRKGAEKYNDPYSQARLGEILYLFGANCDERPSQKDKSEGKKWIEKGAAGGDSHAIQLLSEIK